MMVKVMIYTTPTCPWCKKAKDFLQKKKVSYTEINVADDGQARAEILKKTGQMGVPVIVIGKKIIIGFDQQQLEKALGA